ncbi:MAG TPA: ABC transporter ATP-binding protein [Prolixibacteraceae bacterium]|nr:ABC transporter ATP-binding protein [Prolixibacteraceae bacterium]
MLNFNHITKSYRKGGRSFTALDDLTFQVDKGEFIAITGPSGSGKSTLLHTAGGLIHPDSGEVLYKGNDVYSLNNHQADLYRRENVGFVFQQFHLVPYLTVYENIKLACLQPAHNTHIERYLEKCSVAALRNKYPSELSVGEKQRIAFIRAIITSPDILLADEPTGNLDPLNSSILMSLIEDFHKSGGTVLLVSHDRETANYAGRYITLQSGKLA